MDDLKTVLYQDKYCYDKMIFKYQYRIGDTIPGDSERIVREVTLVEMINNKLIHVTNMDLNNLWVPIDCLVYFALIQEVESDE